MNISNIEMLTLISFFILVIWVAFSNHEQVFLKSKQFKLIFLILIVCASSYNKCSALILLLTFIVFDNDLMEGFPIPPGHNELKPEHNELKPARPEVMKEYKTMFCDNCGSKAKDKLKDDKSKNDLDEMFQNVFFSSGINPTDKNAPFKHACDDDDLQIYATNDSFLNKFRGFLGLTTIKDPCSLTSKFLVGDNNNGQLEGEAGEAHKVSLIDECVKGLTVTSSVSTINAQSLLFGNWQSPPQPHVGEITLTFTFPEVVTLDGFTFPTYMYAPSTGVIENWTLKDESNKVVINGPEVNTGGDWAILKGTSDKIVQNHLTTLKSIKATDIITFPPHSSRVWHLTLDLSKKLYIYFVRFHGRVGK